MERERNYGVMDILRVIFLMIFALPFVGGYLFFDKEMETKVIGGILCVVGLAIWFLFGIH